MLVYVVKWSTPVGFGFEFALSETEEKQLYERRKDETKVKRFTLFMSDIGNLIGNLDDNNVDLIVNRISDMFN